MNTIDKKGLKGITALLVHAAKIDEIYSEHEKTLIKDFVKSYLTDENPSTILKEAEEIEKNSNQLLSFTSVSKLYLFVSKQINGIENFLANKMPFALLLFETIKLTFIGKL